MEKYWQCHLLTNTHDMNSVSDLCSSKRNVCRKKFFYILRKKVYFNKKFLYFNSICDQAALDSETLYIFLSFFYF